MRDILFRGKAAKPWFEGEWVYGFPFIRQTGEATIRYYDEHFGSSKVVAVKNETLTQYTGLEDINGKKIFEGDIVKIEEQNWWQGDKNKWLLHDWYLENNKGYYFVTNNGVDWVLDENRILSEHSWVRLSYFLESHDDYKYRFIVIGNKWDNPELI